MKEKDKYNNKFWNKKVYSRNQMHTVFSKAVMPHLFVSLLLSTYILFRFSIFEGVICLALSVVSSLFINKKLGLI